MSEGGASQALLRLRQPHLPPNNLPGQLTSFVGRAAQVAELRNRLASSRLVTLTGMGGIGKTRLALAAASAVVPSFPSGVWLVEAGRFSDPVQVARELASLLGVQPGADVVRSLADHLAGARVLVVLDNCEHLVDGCATLAHALLTSCPGLTVLATSREPLRVAGEVVRTVPPLPIDDPDGGGAVQLFGHRALAVQPAFVPDLHTGAVTGICRRLDGIPLAVELAAAMAGSLSPREIETRLDDQLGLLAGGPRSAPRRHRTLRATLDWSHDLLTSEEQALLRRAAVFAGSFSLADAEEVCAGAGIAKEAVLPLVRRLVDKSLLVANVGPESARYRMLQPVREYARERLEAAAETRPLRARHARHYTDRATLMAEPGLHGPDQARWLRELDVERDNLREALAWCREGGDPAVGLRLAGALWRFWYLRGYIAEGREHLEGALAAAAAAPTSDRAKALRGAGVLARMHGELPRARDCFEEALGICRRLDDRRGVASLLNSLGVLAWTEGDLDRARAVIGGECLGLYRELGDLRGVATCLNNLSVLTRLHGDHSAAMRFGLDSLRQYRQIGFQEGVAAALLSVAGAAFAQGRLEPARAAYRESLGTFRDLGYREGMAECLERLGLVAAAERRDTLAVLLLAAAEALRELLAAPLAGPGAAAEIREAAAALRRRMRAEAFAQAWTIGRVVPVEEAVDRALGLHAEHAEPLPGGLSAREVEVLAMLARGLRDREIGRRLGISVRTVQKHVEHVRDKLGTRSRGQLGAWAVQHGLASGGSEEAGDSVRAPGAADQVSDRAGNANRTWTPPPG